MLLSAINFKNKKNEIYNLGTGNGNTIIKAINIISKELFKQKKITLNYKFLPFPKNIDNIQKRNYVADISKIKKKLNFIPKYSLKRGVNDFIRLIK